MERKESRRGTGTVWPDVKLKVALIGQKLPKMLLQQYFTKKWCSLKKQKVTKYLGYFCEKICLPELSQIAQIGHTGPETKLGNCVWISHA